TKILATLAIFLSILGGSASRMSREVAYSVQFLIHQAYTFNLALEQISKEPRSRQKLGRSAALHDFAAIQNDETVAKRDLPANNIVVDYQNRFAGADLSHDL